MPKKKKKPAAIAIPPERIEKSIYLIRGLRVMLDEDLAELYDVPTKRLNEQVGRNIARFPDHFMFQLTRDENEALRSHFATSKVGRGGRRSLPYAFTEYGIVMLASVLRSERAIAVSIEITQAFVRLRELLASHDELAKKLAALENKYDAKFRVVFDAIRELMAPPPDTPKPRIGFKRDK